MSDSGNFRVETDDNGVGRAFDAQGRIVKVFYPPAMRGRSCPQCSGSGKISLFITVQSCESCGGTGQALSREAKFFYYSGSQAESGDQSRPFPEEPIVMAPPGAPVAVTEVLHDVTRKYDDQWRLISEEHTRRRDDINPL